MFDVKRYFANLSVLLSPKIAQSSQYSFCQDMLDLRLKFYSSP